MKVVLQRVNQASVSIDGHKVGEIGEGILALVGFMEGDDDSALDWMTDKLVHLRIFADESGRMNRSLLDVGGGLLVVSQFTLYGDARKGRRPSFVDAAHPDLAIPLYKSFVARLRGAGVQVETGRFGAMMQVELINDGPVTLILER